MRELDEYELVRGCLSGSCRAEEALYARYAPRMFFVCLRYARDRAGAEDMLQDGFIRVFDKLGTFRMDGSLEGWIRRIMVTTCINHLRKGWLHHEVPVAGETNEHAVMPQALGDMGHDELLRLVQALPDGYRAVFNLYAIEGYGHAEIAAQLGCNEGTSRSQLAKARRALQRGVEQLNSTKRHEGAPSDR